MIKELIQKDILFLKNNISKIHLSGLQDLYHKRLTEKGYDLERGIKGSARKRIKIKDYKRINRSLEQNLSVRNNRLGKVISESEKI